MHPPTSPRYSAGVTLRPAPAPARGNLLIPFSMLRARRLAAYLTPVTANCLKTSESCLDLFSIFFSLSVLHLPDAPCFRCSACCSRGCTSAYLLLLLLCPLRLHVCRIEALLRLYYASVSVAAAPPPSFSASMAH